MAVLRASNLWAAVVPGGSETTWDTDPVTGEPRATTPLFYVPAGKRMIIRSITNVPTNSLQAGEHPSIVMQYQIAGTGPYYPFHRFWWKSVTGASPYEYVAEDNWQGMVVLNTGWLVSIWTIGSHNISTTGSGMLVDIT